MKPTKYFLLIIVFLSYMSCRQTDAVPYFGIDFLFKEPQSINDIELKHFPNKLIGSYINQDSTYLIITDKVICNKWIKRNNVSLSEFDSVKDSVKIIGNRMYLLDSKKFFDFRKVKDSIEITDTYYDTIFSISNFNKANKIKGAFVLNTKDSIYWKIKVLSLDKKNLKLMTLVSEDDLARIDSLSKIKVQKIDSTRNVIELSKAEFKRMLTLKNLGHIQEYKKLN
ncbi:hypothetical protein [Flavobacterium dankookense]|uniref:Uncharacterized protein n=1 Tax=Flavobacterium dankookense TaxID=706186 RepID=A0A4R6QH07_9FLAO|nr:hypothetical protein [Flavobacterium dankookense]TDP60849.1 hypothetical protein BC748_0449 [Flavobacterium dankookense]